MKVTVKLISVVLSIIFINANLTIYVYGNTVEKNILFDDISENDWYYNAIVDVCEKGLMTGTGNNNFSPDMSATRGMIASVIYRLEGSPEVNESKIYSDVLPGQWHYYAILWTTQNNIFSGFKDDTFKPNNTITREQIISVFYRYAQYKGWNINCDNIKEICDNIVVSDWAKDYALWAINNKIIYNNSNYLDLTSNASRGEIAYMLDSILDYNVSIASNKRIDTIEEKSSSLTEKSITTKESNDFKYLLYTPANPKDNMPLIVYLHGASGKGNNLSALTSVDGFPLYVKSGSIGNVPAYIIMPQLTSEKKGWDEVKNSLIELINYMKNTYNIDTNHISLTGHSMGGTGVWNIALSNPDLFSCIAPMSGSIKNTKENLEKLSKIPIWAFVGANDTIVNPDTSKIFINKLSLINNQAKITIFDNATHFDVPSLAYLDKDIDLVDWLINNHKN